MKKSMLIGHKNISVYFSILVTLHFIHGLYGDQYIIYLYISILVCEYVFYGTFMNIFTIWLYAIYD